jgi:hypothetical protein
MSRRKSYQAIGFAATNGWMCGSVFCAQGIAPHIKEATSGYV